MKKIPKLTYWANRYSLKYWGREFDCEIKYNSRIRSKYGHVMYHVEEYKPFILEINPVTIKLGKFKKTLLHELCHYFLIVDGKRHDELDEIFLKELRRVGGSMPSVPTGVIWVCAICKEVIYSGKYKRVDWNYIYKNRKCNCYGPYSGTIHREVQYTEVE